MPRKQVCNHADKNKLEPQQLTTGQASSKSHTPRKFPTAAARRSGVAPVFGSLRFMSHSARTKSFVSLLRSLTCWSTVETSVWFDIIALT